MSICSRAAGVEEPETSSDSAAIGRCFGARSATWCPERCTGSLRRSPWCLSWESAWMVGCGGTPSPTLLHPAALSPCRRRRRTPLHLARHAQPVWAAHVMCGGRGWATSWAASSWSSPPQRRAVLHGHLGRQGRPGRVSTQRRTRSTSRTPSTAT